MIEDEYIWKFLTPRQRRLLKAWLWVSDVFTWRYGRASRHAPAKRVYVGETPTTASTSEEDSVPS